MRRSLATLPLELIFTKFFTAAEGEPNPFHAPAAPPAFPRPELLAVSAGAMELVGIDAEEAKLPRFAHIFSGSEVLEGAQPWAFRYGGHQFGSWAGTLGDGRAINIFELRHNGQSWTFQVKGTGPTPFSRGFDGRAVLRSCLREFLCSEAMHFLGVPTVRTLALIGTGEGVTRDILYSGNPRVEPGAVVCRVARSFTRFGSFEILAEGDPLALDRLVDYTVADCYPQLGELPREAKRLALVARVAADTAELVARWQAVGFVHGVMNTDNMSILSETIDYGPFGFLEQFDPRWTPNTTDARTRRYAYGNQPKIALWNLTMLARVLLDPTQSMEALGGFVKRFQAANTAQFGRKLGVAGALQPEQLQPVLERLEGFMSAHKADFTLLYRELGEHPLDELLASPQLQREVVSRCCYLPEATPAALTDFAAFLAHYQQLLAGLGVADEQRRAVMSGANPRYVLRNYLLFECYERAEKGDLAMLRELQQMIERPFERQEQFEKYYAKRPAQYADVPGCSMLSCSS